MNSSNMLSRQDHRLLQVGLALFLFGALVGVAIPRFTVPLIALSAHLIGILQDVFLPTLGLAAHSEIGITMRYL